MKCSSCPHLKSIEAGEYDSKPWKDTPCAKCRLYEDSSRFMLPFDEENPPMNVAFGRTAFSDATGGVADSLQSSLDAEPQDPDTVLLPASIISRFMQGFLSLEPCLRDIVIWRYQGLSYREIAEQQDTSPQLAEARHRRALRDWPELKALFPLKIAKQARRKSHR